MEQIPRREPEEEPDLPHVLPRRKEGDFQVAQLFGKRWSLQEGQWDADRSIWFVLRRAWLDAFAKDIEWTEGFEEAIMAAELVAVEEDNVDWEVFLQSADYYIEMGPHNPEEEWGFVTHMEIDLIWNEVNTFSPALFTGNLDDYEQNFYTNTTKLTFPRETEWKEEIKFSLYWNEQLPGWAEYEIDQYITSVKPGNSMRVYYGDKWEQKIDPDTDPNYSEDTDALLTEIGDEVAPITAPVFPLVRTDE